MHKRTRRNTLTLLIAVVGWVLCGTSHADIIMGGLSAGFQSWTGTATDLNNNHAPYWDYPTNYTSPPLANGNVGFCLTTGCAGQLSPGPAPGAIQFWGLSYNSATDTGGGLDPNLFFHRTAPETLRATLEVSLAQSPPGIIETNSFGWFETDSLGSVIGTRHPLFSPTSPVTAVATFQPTEYYGYYFHDLSESGLDDTLEACLVFTLSSLNTAPCGPNQLFHNMAVFATDPLSPLTSFWIAGLNAVSECVSNDCNLTLVRVDPVPEPMSVLILITGCAGLLFVYGKRRRYNGRDRIPPRHCVAPLAH
jgi:hypothetical protein